MKKKSYSASYIRQRTRRLSNLPESAREIVEAEERHSPFILPVLTSSDEGGTRQQRNESQPPKPEVLLSEPEAAEALKMSVRQLADRRRAGRIECFKQGHFIAYSWKHITNYLADTQQQVTLDPLTVERYLIRLKKQVRQAERPSKARKKRTKS